jgi:hypothetical protein
VWAGRRQHSRGAGWRPREAGGIRGRPEERPREPGWAAADDIEGWLGVDRGPPGGSGRGGDARAGQWRPGCRRRRGWAWAPTGRRRIGLRRQRACEACMCVCEREREWKARAVAHEVSKKIIISGSLWIFGCKSKINRRKYRYFRRFLQDAEKLLLFSVANLQPQKVM